MGLPSSFFDILAVRMIHVRILHADDAEDEDEDDALDPLDGEVAGARGAQQQPLTRVPSPEPAGAVEWV